MPFCKSSWEVIREILDAPPPPPWCCRGSAPVCHQQSQQRASWESLLHPQPEVFPHSVLDYREVTEDRKGKTRDEKGDKRVKRGALSAPCPINCHPHKDTGCPQAKDLPCSHSSLPSGPAKRHLSSQCFCEQSGRPVEPGRKMEPYLIVSGIWH